MEEHITFVDNAEQESEMGKMERAVLAMKLSYINCQFDLKNGLIIIRFTDFSKKKSFYIAIYYMISDLHQL